MCNKVENNVNQSCECLRDILKIILILQENAEEKEERCLDTCDKRVLGKSGKCKKLNTRPVTIFTCCPNGANPLRMPISKEPDETTLSHVFRIEKLDGCCATFRVLKQVHCDTKEEYVATDSFFTINLNCVCILRCLEDTFVDCL